MKRLIFLITSFGLASCSSTSEECSLEKTNSKFVEEDKVTQVETAKKNSNFLQFTWKVDSIGEFENGKVLNVKSLIYEKNKQSFLFKKNNSFFVVKNDNGIILEKEIGNYSIKEDSIYIFDDSGTKVMSYSFKIEGTTNLIMMGNFNIDASNLRRPVFFLSK